MSESIGPRIYLIGKVLPELIRYYYSCKSLSILQARNNVIADADSIVDSMLRELSNPSSKS